MARRLLMRLCPGRLVLLTVAAWALQAGCTRPCPTLRDLPRQDACCEIGDGLIRDVGFDAGLDAGLDAKIDSQVPDCHPTYEACHLAFGPVEIGSGSAQDPDVTYGNGRILATYMDYDDFGGATIVGYSLTGTELFREENVGGLNFPTLAWNRDLGVGLLAAACGVRWLGSDGRPVGEFQDVPLNGDPMGDNCEAVVAPVPGGFAVVASQSWYEEGSPVYLGGAFLGSRPEALSWESVMVGSVPWLAFEAALDQEGWARYFVSTTWSDYGDAAMALTVGNGVLTPFDLAEPGRGQVIVAAAVHGGSLYLVWRPDGYEQDFWLERVEPHQLWRLETGEAWADTALLHVGRDLVLVERIWQGNSEVLQMSRLDLTRDSDPRVDSRVLMPGDSVWAMKATEIPGRGFALVWGGGNDPVELMSVDCCSVDSRESLPSN